jgi:hypothetical protein
MGRLIIILVGRLILSLHQSSIQNTSFLMNNQEDGHQTRATIFKLIEDYESSIHDNTARIKFILSLNNDQGKDIVTYNKIMEFICKDEESDIIQTIMVANLTL